MAKGKKTGGRSRGTPNKKVSPVAHVFARLGGEHGEVYAEELHRIATQEADPNVRTRAISIIRDYLPWQKTADRLELTGQDGGPVLVKFVDVDAGAAA